VVIYFIDHQRAYTDATILLSQTLLSSRKASYLAKGMCKADVIFQVMDSRNLKLVSIY